MYIKSSKNRKGRRIYAEEEIETNNGGVEVAPEATELMFETEDVAELIAEVTGSDVEVVADEDQVTFTVGDMDYTVEAEGNEEILESTSLRGRTAIKSNKTVSRNNRPVAASRNTDTRGGRTIRRIK